MFTQYPLYVVYSDSLKYYKEKNYKLGDFYFVYFYMNKNDEYSIILCSDVDLKICLISVYQQCILYTLWILLKGTVSIISSDPPCKDGNAQFTIVPLKPISDQYILWKILSVCF